MYQLISAIAKPIDSQGRWMTIALGDLLLPDVFSDYEQVLAVLTNPLLPSQVSLDLATIRAQWGSQSITFSQFLTANGNTTLETSTTIPTINTRYARYADAFRAGYDIQSAPPIAAPDAQLPPSDKTWLMLTKAGVDYAAAYRSLLVSVNGLIHATDSGPNGLYVQDGMVSKEMSNQATIGVYSFAALGDLTFIPITPSMVYKQDAQQVYADRAHVDLGQDVSTKTVMLVLGGYLHVLDPRSFYRVGDSTFAVVFQNLPMLDRYYDSKDFIDLSSMGLETSTVNSEQIGVADLYSDRSLLAYLTLSQSFFVVLDNAEIFLETDLIVATKSPHSYISHQVPNWPLITELGKMVNYSYRYEDGQFSISALNAYRNDFNFRTVDAKNVLSVDSNRNTVRPFTNGDLRYLQIGADI